MTLYNAPLIDQMTADEIIQAIERYYPGLLELVNKAQEVAPYLKRQIWQWQACVLGMIARQFNFFGANFLEVGTAWGYSAAAMAMVAPKAGIITLNPKATEYPYAVKHLAGFSNVIALETKSAEYFDATPDLPLFDLIFIDGDHSLEAVLEDARWFNRLKLGGLILFHDYSPSEAKRASPSVYEAVNKVVTLLGRPLDIIIRDDTLTGMAGLYRRAKEILCVS